MMQGPTNIKCFQYLYKWSVYRFYFQLRLFYKWVHITKTFCLKHSVLHSSVFQSCYIKMLHVDEDVPISACVNTQVLILQLGFSVPCPRLWSKVFTKISFGLFYRKKSRKIERSQCLSFSNVLMYTKMLHLLYFRYSCMTMATWKKKIETCGRFYTLKCHLSKAVVTDGPLLYLPNAIRSRIFFLTLWYQIT